MPIVYYIFLYAIVYVGGVGVLINIYQFLVSINAFMSHGCIACAREHGPPSRALGMD